MSDMKISILAPSFFYSFVIITTTSEAPSWTFGAHGDLSGRSLLGYGDEKYLLRQRPRSGVVLSPSALRGQRIFVLMASGNARWDLAGVLGRG
jgi:hypothetical protein